MWHDILLVVLGLIVGLVIGFFVARTLMKKYMKKNPPINEKRIDFIPFFMISYL